MIQGDFNARGMRTRLFLVLVSAIGVASFAFALVVVVSGAVNPEWILLALVTALLVSRIELGAPRTVAYVRASEIFLFLSVLLYGGYPSVVLGGLDALMSSVQRKLTRLVVGLNLAVSALAVYACSEGIGLIFGELAPLEMEFGRLFLVTSSLAVCYCLIIRAVASVVAALQGVCGFLESLRESLVLALLSYIGGALATCLMIRLIALISFYSFIIAVPILAIIYFTYKVYLDRVEASNRHAEQMAELHLKTIEALAIAIDAKDEVSHDHVHRVQIYATGLAKLFGLGEPEIEALKAGALLHDIGKLAVPDYILNKPGPLTSAEFEKMKVHTVVGAEILERVGFPYPVVPVVRHHHERWDGRGYPDGLKGDQIPITARILTVADSFDAMQEDRQYRRAMSREKAIQTLKEGSGTVFDPAVVSIFLEHLSEFEAEIRLLRVETQAREGCEPMAVGGARTGDSTPRAFERIRSAHREVITLYDIAQTIGTSLDLRDTFAVFSSRLEDIVRYTTCVLYLQRSDSTEVEAAHASGRYAERFKGRRISSGAGITGWVVANRHPMHNCDPRLDFDALRVDIPEAYHTASVVPLIREEEVLGALALYSVELDSYDSDQLRLVEAVAKLASDAIANAVRHEITEASALTDLPTGLPNARALRYRFEEETDRARRHRDTFTIVMMDLDGFKEVNDRLGHQAGDQLLKEVAALLLGLVRTSDFVSRYAGDEFVAILQVGAEEAQELMHRLQKALDRHHYSAGGSNIRLGVSVGWATFGVEGETLDELLLAADRAMYADKLRRKSPSTDVYNKSTGTLRPVS